MKIWRMILKLRNAGADPAEVSNFALNLVKALLNLGRAMEQPGPDSNISFTVFENSVTKYTFTPSFDLTLLKPLHETLKPLSDPAVFALVFKFVRDNLRLIIQHHRSLPFGRLKRNQPLDVGKLTDLDAQPLINLIHEFRDTHADQALIESAQASPPAVEPRVPAPTAPSAPSFDHAGLRAQVVDPAFVSPTVARDGLDPVFFERAAERLLKFVNQLLMQGVVWPVVAPDWAEYARTFVDQPAWTNDLHTHLSERQNVLIASERELAEVSTSLALLDQAQAQLRQTLGDRDLSEGAVSTLDRSAQDALRSAAGLMTQLPLVVAKARAAVELRQRTATEHLRSIQQIELLISERIHIYLNPEAAPTEVGPLEHALRVLADESKGAP